jgi:hypothetical protein
MLGFCFLSLDPQPFTIIARKYYYINCNYTFEIAYFRIIVE